MTLNRTCNVQFPYPRRAFLFYTPIPFKFPFQWVLVILPLAPPEISVIIQPGLVSPGKNSSVNNVVAIYIYAKDNWRGIWIYIFWNYNYRLFGLTLIDCTLPLVFICLLMYSLINKLILTSVNCLFFSL